jgi:hypothetical protein
MEGYGVYFKNDDGILSGKWAKGALRNYMPISDPLIERAVQVCPL